MTRKLVWIRLQSMLAAMTAQGRRKKSSGKGTLVLYTLLYLYVVVVMFGMMGANFYTLAQPYHQFGLDWLYFAVAGFMALGFAVIGSVFTTQSQLYDAKDNALLLSMPIPPSKILLSRMIPLLLMNLLFASMVMLPAIVVYAVFVQFRFIWVLLQLLALAAIVLFAQAIACILGWLLHLMLGRINKSMASILFLVAFLGIYFVTISRAQDLLNALIGNSTVIANTLVNWVWPLYAMGLGCIGSLLHAPVMPLTGAAVFGLVYWFLSRTFINSATRTHAASKKRVLILGKGKQASPVEAVIRKEIKKFMGTPIYVTNMGMGILMIVAMTVAGVIFRRDLSAVLDMIPDIQQMIPLFVCGATAFSICTMCISTPSVSLEGKNIWILKSLPLSSKDILLAKLRFHNRMTVPVSCICGGVLAAAYGCSLWSILLCALVPGLLALLNGLVGMVAGLKWARLDYISEAYPCKQSASVAVSMFGLMGIVALLGIGDFLLGSYLDITVLLLLNALVLGGLCFLFYRLLTTWGIRAWDAL